MTSDGILIAGGGLAAQRAAETLRSNGYDGRVRMVCAEPRLPYDRPPLSKAVLSDPNADATTAFRTRAWYADHDIDVLTGARATHLDVEERAVVLASGQQLHYDQLLIATGSSPRRLELLDRFSNVSVLRTLDDARLLRAVLGAARRLVIVGAGFIGQEAAAAATAAGVDVTLVEAAPSPMETLLGPSVGAWFTGLHESRGARLIAGAQLAAAKTDASRRVRELTLDDGTRLKCDHVLVGIGAYPETGWLAGTPLAGDGLGIPTDTGGATAVPGVFSAGDVAAVYDPVAGRHLPGGHWESARHQGARAAKAMLQLPNGPIPAASFWSDLYKVRIQYLGHAPLAEASSLEGDPDANDFRVTYLRAGRPVAVLLVNRPHELPTARAALAA
jgi:NADPH-dependent 2,4-dienoyl-CoA reductase/sulfur reductase-like enzyme